MCTHTYRYRCGVQSARKYGHKAAHCGRENPLCSKCGGGHDSKQCSVKEKEIINARTAVSRTAYRRIKRYQQVSKTLTVATKLNMSYSDTVKKLVIANRQNKKAAEQVPPPDRPLQSRPRSSRLPQSPLHPRARPEWDRKMKRWSSIQPSRKSVLKHKLTKSQKARRLHRYTQTAISSGHF